MVVIFHWWQQGLCSSYTYHENSVLTGPFCHAQYKPGNRGGQGAHKGTQQCKNVMHFIKRNKWKAKLCEHSSVNLNGLCNTSTGLLLEELVEINAKHCLMSTNVSPAEDKGINGMWIKKKHKVWKRSPQFFIGPEGSVSTSLLCTCIIPKEITRISVFSMIHRRDI